MAVEAEGKVNENVTHWISKGPAAVAILVSLAMAVALTLIDVRVSETLRMAKSKESAIGAYGTLQGWSAATDTEWVPRVVEGRDQIVVLFSAAGLKAGSIDYWRHVVDQVVTEDTGIQFAGMCDVSSECVRKWSQDGRISPLTSMEPVQMRALARAARQGRVLVYRDAVFKASLPIVENPEALAAEIVRIAGRVSGSIGVPK